MSVVEDSALDQVLDDAHEFRTQCAKFRILAEAKVKELVAADAQDVVSQDSQAAVNVKLPKFSGDVIQWQSFWDQFISHIDATDIPVISKYAYLLSLLEGDAKNVVKGLAHTSANYQVACDLLKERYGRKERIIFTHVQALLNGKLSISTSGEKTVTQLWKLRDEILTHVRSLEALGVTGKQCEVFLTPIILSRLPHDLRLEWARDGDGHESDLDFLLDFLYKEISRLERSEAFRGKKNVAEGKTESSAPKEKKFSAAALHTSSKQEPPVCCFCKKKHKSENCFNVQKLSGQERGEKIRSLGVCFKCLNSGHSSRFCKAQIKCASCEGNHNTLMCGVKLDFSPRQEVNKGQKSDNVTLVSSQGGSCTVLQTAKNRCLWDIRDGGYTKKTLKRKAYNDITLFLRAHFSDLSSINADQVRAKYNNMRTYFLKEYRKTQIAPSGSSGIFQPKVELLLPSGPQPLNLARHLHSLHGSKDILTPLSVT
ncbi:uncharacterized protein LOC122265587 [Penaeus japonicus]|uniref:uncharacterized protein LOC122265587 n=1 Tax=Penaeus japonicus TaxID=27405 RepID=UPI001C713BC9|nr:uncharacterized protein LOC122265587 [Penaeus japonicus]